MPGNRIKMPLPQGRSIDFETAIKAANEMLSSRKMYAPAEPQLNTNDDDTLFKSTY